INHPIHIFKNLSVNPLVGEGPAGGYSPNQLRHAYGFDKISFNNGTVQGDGTGQTIAIICGYNQPNILSDLAIFDSTFGVPPPPNFTIVNQTGGTSLPPADQGSGLEISSDIEWAHAIAPGANILLVEANSNNWID